MTPDLLRLRVRLLCTRLALDDKPILVGPWRSEVGFEALYWLPFLQYVAKHVPDFWQRALIVSRGAGHVLYPSERHVDLYALRSVTDVRRENLKDWARTKLQKQIAVTPWDRTILAEAAAQAGIQGRYHVLHPSVMYRALAPFWDEDRGLKYLLSLTDYTPLPKPVSPCELNGLPERYVAVKFYGRATWPHPHPETTGFVAHVVGTLAKQIPVLLLSTGHDGDEHTDMAISGPNIYRLPETPSHLNLGLQLAVLGKAAAFVGTYGGVAQAALRMGVPSLSAYTEFGGTAHAHLSLSSWLSKRLNVPFVVGSLGDAHLWQQVLIPPPPAPTVGPIPSQVEAVPA